MIFRTEPVENCAGVRVAGEKVITVPVGRGGFAEETLKVTGKAKLFKGVTLIEVLALAAAGRIVTAGGTSGFIIRLP